MIKRRFRAYPLLVLLCFLLVAYFPVFLPFFHIKNDLITQNLPTRFFISESLYSHCFPWWNPYINFGIPQYGDMNNGFWNPLLWLIARTSGYTIWAITLEEMFYILLGGWGIYLLCREVKTSGAVSLLTGISYMGCGYILGHLQHFCWITGTAFFPYVLLYFIRIHRSPVRKNYIAGGISVALFLAATHPGLIIGALYFFLFAHLGIWLLRNGALSSFYHRRFWIVSGIFLGVSLLFSLVVIVSDIDTLRHISRGSKVSLEQALLYPTTIPSYLSLLFPTAVQHASFPDTDISMRNAYIGLVLLAGFLTFCRYANRRMLAFTLAVLLFFIGLAAGGWFKTFAYHFLPFTGNVRLDGEFSYFVTLIMLLAGAWGLETYLHRASPRPRRPYAIAAAACGLIAVLCLPMIHQSADVTAAASAATQTAARAHWKQTIRSFIDNISFWQLLLIGSILQGLTLLYLARRGPGAKNLVLATAANLVLTCWLILPFTGLGMASKADRQRLISSFPRGIHPQEQLPLDDTRFIDSAHRKDLTLLGDYSKKIGYPKEEQYPVEITTAETLYNDTTLFDFIRRQSFLFMSMDTTAKTATGYDSSAIRIIRFCPDNLAASVDNDRFHYLTFLQNDYPYWKIKLDGRPVPHFTGFRTFMTIPIPRGSHVVEYTFDPQPVKTAGWIDLGILLAALVSLIVMPAKANDPSGTSSHSRY